MEPVSSQDSDSNSSNAPHKVWNSLFRSTKNMSPTSRHCSATNSVQSKRDSVASLRDVCIGVGAPPALTDTVVDSNNMMAQSRTTQQRSGTVHTSLGRFSFNGNRTILRIPTSGRSSPCFSPSLSPSHSASIQLTSSFGPRSLHRKHNSMAMVDETQPAQTCTSDMRSSLSPPSHDTEQPSSRLHRNWSDTRLLSHLSTPQDQSMPGDFHESDKKRSGCAISQGANPSLPGIRIQTLPHIVFDTSETQPPQAPLGSGAEKSNSVSIEILSQPM